jgi:hypothetical protein
VTWFLLIVAAVVVVPVPAVALVGAVTVGRRSGYDVAAYFRAYEERRDAGAIPDVMTPEPVA